MALIQIFENAMLLHVIFPKKFYFCESFQKTDIIFLWSLPTGQVWFQLVSGVLPKYFKINPMSDLSNHVWLDKVPDEFFIGEDFLFC